MIDRALEDLLISQSVKNEKSLDLGYSLQPEWCGKEERRSRAGSWGDVPCHSVSMPWHVYTWQRITGWWWLNLPMNYRCQSHIWQLLSSSVHSFCNFSCWVACSDGYLVMDVSCNASWWICNRAGDGLLIHPRVQGYRGLLVTIPSLLFKGFPDTQVNKLPCAIIVSILT